MITGWIASAVGALAVFFGWRAIQARAPKAPIEPTDDGGPPASARCGAGMAPWERFQTPDGSTPVPGAAKPSWGNVGATDDGENIPPSWWPPMGGTSGAPCHA